MKGTMIFLLNFIFLIVGAQQNVFNIPDSSGIDFNVEPPVFTKSSMPSFNVTTETNCISHCNQRGRLDISLCRDSLQFYNAHNKYIGNKTALVDFIQYRNRYYFLNSNDTNLIYLIYTEGQGLYSKLEYAIYNSVTEKFISTQNQILDFCFILNINVLETQDDSRYYISVITSDTMYAFLFNDGLISKKNASPYLQGPLYNPYEIGSIFAGGGRFLFTISSHPNLIKLPVFRYNFDTSTGIFSNKVFIDSTYLYHMEFVSSFNDSLVFYYSALNPSTPSYVPLLKVVNVYNLTSKTIPLSKHGYVGFVRGPNRKIYLPTFLNLQHWPTLTFPDSSNNFILNEFGSNLSARIATSILSIHKYYDSYFIADKSCSKVKVTSVVDANRFKSFRWYVYRLDSNYSDSFDNQKTLLLPPGSYYIKLKATAYLGYVQWYSDTLLSIRPRAAITASLNNGCQYVDYTFTDSSYCDTTLNGNVTCYWNFGDGKDTSFTISRFRLHYSINHTYTSSGAFNVWMTLNNGFCSDTVAFLNKVTILPAPKPGFTISAPSWCAPPILCTITAHTTLNVVRYFYSFGNGDTFSTASPAFSYTFSNSGTFTVKQTVLGNTGCITSDSFVVRISPGLKTSDSVNLLSSSVINPNSTLTSWRKIPNAVFYTVNNKPVNDTFYFDAPVDASKAGFVYTVQAVDSCGGKSAPATNNTIFLQVNNVDENKYADISFSPYSYWKNGVNYYEVQVFYNQQWITVAKLNATTHTYRDLQFLDTLISYTNSLQKCYRIVAFEKNGNQQLSISNEVCAPFTPVAFIPNAFSPNGDGINDLFAPVLLGMNVYYLRIYDRWGQEVYSTSSENPGTGWDGKVLGQEAKPGMYVWAFTAISRLKSSQFNTPANSIEKHGTLILLK